MNEFDQSHSPSVHSALQLGPTSPNEEKQQRHPKSSVLFRTQQTLLKVSFCILGDICLSNNSKKITFLFNDK